MKLVSTFKDFYDSILFSMFRDDYKKIYIRNPEGENLEKDYMEKFYGYFTQNEKTEYLYFYSVFFCGKTYNYIVLESKDKVVVFKTYEEYLSFVETSLIKIAKYNYGERYRSKPLVEGFFKNIVPTPEKAAIAVIQPNLKTILNANLSKIHFQKVLDPYTAAMEFYNYVNGVLSCVCTPESKFDDKTILMAKGFDPKTSFRRM